MCLRSRGILPYVLFSTIRLGYIHIQFGRAVLKASKKQAERPKQKRKRDKIEMVGKKNVVFRNSHIDVSCAEYELY